MTVTLSAVALGRVADGRKSARVEARKIKAGESFRSLRESSRATPITNRRLSAVVPAVVIPMRIAVGEMITERGR